MFSLMILIFSVWCVSASAVVNNTVKVGLKYGSNSLYSANLENYSGHGQGYEFGYFDDQRVFVPLGVSTDKTAVSMTEDGNIYLSGGVYSASASSNAEVIGGYHIQLYDAFYSYTRIFVPLVSRLPGFRLFNTTFFPLYSIEDSTAFLV